MNEKHKTYKYKCNKCEYSAPHESDLKEHMNEKHETYKYKCNNCEYSAQQEIDLKEHMNEGIFIFNNSWPPLQNRAKP